jgi:hypothetical protein
MLRYALPLALFIALFAVPAPCQDSAQAIQPLSPEDLYRLEGPQTVVVAPDGQRAAVIRRWVDANSRSERFSLWLLPGDAKQARALFPKVVTRLVRPLFQDLRPVQPRLRAHTLPKSSRLNGT